MDGGNREHRADARRSPGLNAINDETVTMASSPRDPLATFDFSASAFAGGDSLLFAPSAVTGGPASGRPTEVPGRIRETREPPTEILNRFTMVFHRHGGAQPGTGGVGEDPDAGQ